MERRRAELIRQFHRQQALRDQQIDRLVDTHHKVQNLLLKLKAIDYDLNQIIDDHWHNVEEAHQHEDQV